MIIYSTDETLVIPIGINPNINYDSSGGDTKTQSKTVNSSTGRQVVLPDEGYDALSKVTVNPYTVERKERMITENGPYEFAPSNADALSSVSIEVSVDTRIEQERTVDSSTETQIVEPEAPYNCLAKVTVNPYVLDSSSAVIEQNGTYAFVPVHDGLSSVTVDVSIDGRSAQAKTVDSSTARQVVEPDSPYNCLSSVTVEPYSLQDKAVNPLKTAQNIIPDSSYGGLGLVTVNAVTASIDSNIQAGNIRKNVNILGVVGTYEGGSVLEYSDVNYIDYDGTLLYAFTKDQFLALSEHPSNPTHTGLVSNGWNWSLSDAKSFVTEYGVLTIGQMYGTEDGMMHIFITVPENNWTLSSLVIENTNNDASVYWGDGIEEACPSGTYTHTYADAGNYEIKIRNNNSGTVPVRKTLLVGSAGNYDSESTGNFVETISSVWTMPYMRPKFPGCKTLLSVVIDIQTDGNFNYPTRSFYGCRSLKSVTIPTGVFNAYSESFYDCRVMETVSIPKNTAGWVSFGQSSFENGISLREISGIFTMPDSLGKTFYNCVNMKRAAGEISSSGEQNFGYCSSLVSVKGMDSIINGYTFYMDISLKDVDLTGITRINEFAFNRCTDLETIHIPSTVTLMQQYAFNQCNNLSNIYVECTDPPTITDYYTFAGIPEDAVFHIPQGTLQDYTSDPNWTRYSSQFVEDL